MHKSDGSRTHNRTPDKVCDSISEAVTVHNERVGLGMGDHGRGEEAVLMKLM